jgi:single-strand DNA-binding protein
MAGSVSKTILIGNVGKDAVIRNSGAGKGIASFSVATSESWKDKNSGERKERTEWHSVVVFAEPLVKFAEHHVKKGLKVYIEGQNQTRKWTDKDGVERYSTEIVLNGFNARLESLERLEGSGAPPAADSPDDYGTTRSSESRPQSGAPAGRGSIDMDEDIPFSAEFR